jgi:acetyl-CoA acetyltransferase
LRIRKNFAFSAEETSRKHNITRKEQDDFAIESYRRAAEAWKSGAFSAEVVPITIPDPRKGDIVIKEDEEYKNIKVDKVASLKPVFKKDGGTVTAANASTLNDGASAVVLASEEKLKTLGSKPLAKIIGQYISLALANFNVYAVFFQPSLMVLAPPLTFQSLPQRPPFLKCWNELA